MKNPAIAQLSQRRILSVQTYARVAGVLLLLTFFAGGFGEVYVPSKLIIANEAAATAENLKSSEFMFRLGFAAYLVEACCDVTLALIFYVLLKPAHRYVSLLAAFFGLMGTATFAAAELFYFAPTLVLKSGGYLRSFSPDQLNAFALMSLNLFGLGAVIFTVFYGMGWVLRGYLMFRSDYFPKFLGVLMTAGGLGFISSNFVLALAPGYRSGWLVLLMLPGMLLLTVWLLVKGVDLPKWEEKTAGNSL
ncbi:MAG TPA: DUF4386 domain-containing protein [Candidatus Deferrimicrobiaceae bacterium]|nr:DUF4386 domain-containing protein [Candidatus Deferrimicrobiaceae bacterium]